MRPGVKIFVGENQAGGEGHGGYCVLKSDSNHYEDHNDHNENQTGGEHNDSIMRNGNDQ